MLQVATAERVRKFLKNLTAYGSGVDNNDRDYDVTVNPGQKDNGLLLTPNYLFYGPEVPVSVQ